MRRHIVAKLEAAGLVLVKGGNRALIHRDGRRVSDVPRRREITPGTVRAIERQAGAELT